jgi:hypothetical protein
MVFSTSPAMARICALAREAKVFCFFSSEKKDFS